MSTVSTVSTARSQGSAVDEGVVTFRAMATDVTLRVLGPNDTAAAALEAAREVFVRVEQACTRFNPDSPLMRANSEPRQWHVVPVECFDALVAARDAHVLTDGLFDPRVLQTLSALGYDKTLPFAQGSVSVPGATAPSGRTTRRRGWKPRFDEGRSAVLLGRDPIDLGGIGKGLACWWAVDRLRGAGQAALVEAGGDLQTLGGGPEGDGWRVGVEDPRGGPEPVAVLAVNDTACATSSTRIRRWRAGDADVHHLIDPRTGAPAHSGLVAVTVIADDAATAEVWSKVLFVTGRGKIRARADEAGLAALWVDHDGVVGTSRAMKPHLVWSATPGR